MQSKNTILGNTLWYTEGIFTNAILEQVIREDSSVVYRWYIHKCNFRTRYKGRQLGDIQKVYSQTQSKNTILGKTTLWYKEGIFTNAI